MMTAFGTPKSRAARSGWVRIASCSKPFEMHDMAELVMQATQSART